MFFHGIYEVHGPRHAFRDPAPPSKPDRPHGESEIANYPSSLLANLIDAIHIKWQSIHIMRTNIDIDDDLMAEAQTRTPGATKRAVVEEALRLLIQTRRQGGLRKLRGKVKWEGDLDAMRTDLPAE